MAKIEEERMRALEAKLQEKLGLKSVRVYWDKHTLRSLSFYWRRQGFNALGEASGWYDQVDSKMYPFWIDLLEKKLDEVESISSGELLMWMNHGGIPGGTLTESRVVTSQ